MTRYFSRLGIGSSKPVDRSCGVSARITGAQDGTASGQRAEYCKPARAYQYCSLPATQPRKPLAVVRSLVARGSVRLCFAGLILSGAAFGAAPPSTQEVLRLAGKALENFWDQLPTVNCIETVRREKLDARGKAIYREESTFDYVALLQMSGNDVLVEESRAPISKAAEEKNTPLLVTNGFSTLALIFHPAFQNAFEYGAPEPLTVDGKSLLKVAFRHVRGARSPSALHLRGHDYPVEWQGWAWIDPANGAIIRIHAELASPMDEIGLKTLDADVRYAPVTFKERPQSYWVPESAGIEVETLRQHWRNTHSFSQYRLFSVDVTTGTEAHK